MVVCFRKGIRKFNKSKFVIAYLTITPPDSQYLTLNHYYYAHFFDDIVWQFFCQFSYHTSRLSFATMMLTQGQTFRFIRHLEG